MPFDSTPAAPLVCPAWLTEREFQALVKTRDALRTEDAIATLFDMRAFERATICGTAQCIGGWMTSFMGILGPERVEVWEDPRFSVLFNYEPRVGSIIIPVMYATAAQAAQAIDNYLSHGDPRWKEVMHG